MSSAKKAYCMGSQGIKILDEAHYRPMRPHEEAQLIVEHEQLQADLAAKTKECKKLGEWYDSVMVHAVDPDAYYKCEKCGGPVASGLCCHWCGDTAPREKEGAKDEVPKP